MARNEELHGPRSDTTRMYLSRKKGGRGLITDVKLVSVGKTLGREQCTLVCKEFRGAIAQDSR